MDKCKEFTDFNCDSDSEEEVGNKAHVLNKTIGDCQQEKENIQDNIKSDSGNSVKFIKFFNEIQSIIKEDECRRNGWEKSEKTSSFPIVNYTEEMSIDEIECSLDKLKQNIINKLNKYFEQLRETDAKLMKMEKEYRNLQETIKLKSENPKKTNYSKESKDNYKSLNLVVNKKSQIQIDQLNDEITTLETENEECRSKMKTWKKELRQNKTLIEDLTDDLKESEEKNKKLQSEIRNLKKQKKDNKKSENEDEVSDLKEQIIKLKSENKQKDEAGKQREKEMNKMKQSLQEKDENCKMLENEKQDILDEKNTLQKKIDEEKIHGEELMKLNEIVEKKNQAIEKIKGKYDNELDLRKDFEEKNKTLKNQCEKLEDEKKIFLDEKKNHEEEQIKLKELVEKKHEALSVLRDKLVYYKAQEKEFEKLRLTTQQLNSKEKEVERLTNELNKLNEALDDKSKECEILRKEKLSCDEEIKNMKQLKFQSKANTESK